MMIMTHFCFGNSNGISLTLAYSLRISGSMKCPSMTLTSCFLFVKAHRHARQIPRFKSRVSWEWWSCPICCCNSTSISLTLAYRFRTSGSMKLSSMISTSWSLCLLRHIDTHGKSPVSKCPCPGNDDHVLFCCWDSNGSSLTLAYSFRISGSMKSPSMTLTSWLLFVF